MDFAEIFSSSPAYQGFFKILGWVDLSPASFPVEDFPKSLLFLAFRLFLNPFPPYFSLHVVCLKEHRSLLSRSDVSEVVMLRFQRKRTMTSRRFGFWVFIALYISCSFSDTLFVWSLRGIPLLSLGFWFLGLLSLLAKSYDASSVLCTCSFGLFGVWNACFPQMLQY